MRITHFLRLADAVLGSFLTCCLLALGAGAYVLGGSPKSYERDAVGRVYANVLGDIEGSARNLRQSYCAQTDSQNRDDTSCTRSP